MFGLKKVDQNKNALSHIVLLTVRLLSEVCGPFCSSPSLRHRDSGSSPRFSAHSDYIWVLINARV